MSWLVAHQRIFRLFMKRKFVAYVLWPLDKRIQNWIYGTCNPHWYELSWQMHLVRDAGMTYCSMTPGSKSVNRLTHTLIQILSFVEGFDRPVAWPPYDSLGSQVSYLMLPSSSRSAQSSSSPCPVVVAWCNFVYFFLLLLCSPSLVRPVGSIMGSFKEANFREKTVVWIIAIRSSSSAQETSDCCS